MNFIFLSQVKCPAQIIPRATMNPGAHSMVGITHNHQHTASLAMVALIQASPLHPTPLIQLPLCILGSRGAILGVHTQDSITPAVLREPATPTHLQCLPSFHPPYQPMS